LTQEKVKNVTLIKAGMDVDRSVANKNISTINAEAQFDASLYANNITAYIIKNSVTK